MKKASDLDALYLEWNLKIKLVLLQFLLLHHLS